jgi:hypothetical protein
MPPDRSVQEFSYSQPLALLRVCDDGISWRTMQPLQRRWLRNSYRSRVAPAILDGNGEDDRQSRNAKPPLPS